MGVSEYARLVLALLRGAVRDRSDLVAENLPLRHQLAVLTRPTRRRTGGPGGALAISCSGCWRGDSGGTGAGIWSWSGQRRSSGGTGRRGDSSGGGRRAPLGRPRLSAEVRELIATMARDNPLWGSERVRGELRKLGIVVSNRSIRRYRGRPPRPPSQTWRTFLTNHVHQLWAADLFVVQTLTFQTLYVLLFITHGRRELVHVNVTAHPTAAWVWRQLVEATAWGRRPRHLVRDRDAVYGGDFVARATGRGIETVLTPVPVRAPRANAVAERAIGSIRRECLDHVVPVDERHLRSILAEYRDYYNRDRPHRALQLETPRPQLRPRAGPIPSVRARPVLNGLHHAYERAA